MDIQAALQSLGVRDDRLSAAEKRTLDEDGYLPLPGMLTPAQVQALRTRLQELEEEEGEEAGKEVHQEAGTARLANLVNKDPIFDLSGPTRGVGGHVPCTGRRLQTVLSKLARFLPGHGMQALHCDGSLSLPGFEVSTEDGSQRFYACNSIWLLSDFTPENGATRLVPGSHRSGLDPRKDLEDPQAPHPDEVLVLGKAGTAFVFNAFTWHGEPSTVRTASGARSTAISFGAASPDDQRGLLRPDTVARISEAQRVVLGV